MKNIGILILLMLLLSSISLPAVEISNTTYQPLLIEEPEKRVTDWNPGDDYKMHFPQLPDPFGWDVDATYVGGVFPQNCLADDWRCSESGPVTDIHFWGSWFNDTIGTIIAFSVAIAEDIPAEQHSIPYSRPGTTLWERTFYPSDWVVAGPWNGLQGWYDPGEGFFNPENHFFYWQYNIEDIENPFIQENGTIYWLSVSAIVLADSPQPRWGWKSSDNHWNDKAVHGFWYELDWINLSEPPSFNKSLDLAFVITGDSAPINHPPNTPSKPVGPTSVAAGIPYTYSTSTTDIDGDQILYGVDAHNDGVVDDWSDYSYPSGVLYTIQITFGNAGTYYLRFIAKDEHGAQSNFSTALVIIVTGANNAPNKPDTPSGPSTGKTGASYTFSTKTIDADGDTVKYGWDWNGDGIVDEWSAYMSSGSTDTRSHTWTTAGTYAIQVKAEDFKGGISAFSTAKTIVITLNSAPFKPTIAGPSYGRIRRSYTYSSTTTDPEGDQLYYWFDWADGTNSGWVGPYSSGQTAIMSHVWSVQGSYSIKVKTKDVFGLESIWSDPLPITMPYTRDSLHRGSFQAELGRNDNRNATFELYGFFRDMRNNHILYGTICSMESERTSRFQGVVSRNIFVIQSAVNNRIINIVGSFNNYDDATQTYYGQWRGFIVGYGHTNGWIRASYR